jgi:3-hydroxybutyryl-CoA dehydrogenase
MPIEEIKTVCYIGAGTMGCFNSLAAAVSGYRVVLYDVDEATLEAVPERHREMAAMLVGGGYCAEEEIPGALARVTVERDLAEATRAADLVSESVFERLDVKRDIHRRLDEVCPTATILTTNSSNLQVSDMEDVVQRGDRFAALHSHLGSPLVDIVPGPRTDPEVIAVLENYVKSTGGVPLVLKKEYPGYLLNAMLGPVLGCALALVVTGVAKREAVDRAWMRKRRAAMGPFGMMDLFGLNLILDSWEQREGDALQVSLRPRVLELLRPYVERGELGMKTGRGFYAYPEPTYQRPGFLEAGDADEALHNSLAVALVGHAILLAARDVADPADIDLAWTVGTYLDTGPFALLAEMGPRKLREALAEEEQGGRVLPAKAREIEAWLQQNPVGK